MEIEAFIRKMKDIYSALIEFIDADDDSNPEFDTLIKLFEKHEILENKEEVRLLFLLISKISDNHHRTSNFFDKLEKIFRFLIKDAPSYITDFIPDYTSYNKRIIFLLFDKKLIKPDESFINSYLQKKSIENKFYYLYPKIKEFLEEAKQKEIEKEIFEKFDEDIFNFEKKCQIGENDSYICSLIRSDSVEEFISFVNRANMSLSSQIKPSIFETNSYLNYYTNTTLIEYAAFFGSIQIIQYLQYNKVSLTFSLWFYAIHSKNAELIHLLEENKVEPEKKKPFFFSLETFKNVLQESIICHHNDIANYIKDNLYEKTQTNDQDQFDDDLISTIVNSLNFFFFPSEIESMICRPNNKNRFQLYQLCFSLTKISIPSSVTSIGDHAFDGCSKITQISIPSSVTTFGDHVFDGILTIEIIGDIKSIPNNLFAECSSLTKITISSSVSSLGDYSFYECTSLVNINVPPSVTSIGDSCFCRCSKLTEISIPSSVTSISDSCFCGCSSLTEISIPSSVTSIGDYCFCGCSSLTEISIPSSVTSIGDFCFCGCSSLTEISIPSSVTSIGDSCFCGCSSLTEISIPSSVTSIGDSCFCRCSKLTKIQIPSSVTSIGDSCFCRCSSLTEISIPSSVASIGDSCFCRCSKLTKIQIPPSVTSLSNSCFCGCSSLTDIRIPSSVTSIGDSCFYGCSKLAKIQIPPSITRISNSCFCGCSSLTEISIPSSITSIGHNAFNGCSSLTKISIPSYVASIGNFAFLGCSLLEQISFENPSSITSVGLLAFSECPSLELSSIYSSIGDKALAKNFQSDILNKKIYKKLIEINKEILDKQIKFYDQHDLIKKLNKTVIFGGLGSGKTSLCCVLSGKDVKIKCDYRISRLICEENSNIFNCPDVMIDESNKFAFIESHLFDDVYGNQNNKEYSTNYLLNEAKVKVILVISADMILCNRGICAQGVFEKFDKIFPKLNDSEKKAVAVVISTDNYHERCYYIEHIHSEATCEAARKWCRYLENHLEQVFLMPQASKHDDGKSYDFEDKYKILDFIKSDELISPKLELLLSPVAKQAITLLQIGSE